MAERLEALGLEPTWFSAVDGRGPAGASVMEHADLARAKKCYGKMASPEVACALSHLNIYRYMVEHGIPAALVLEDDMILDADVPNLIEDGGNLSIISHLPATSAAVVNLTFVRRVSRFGTKKLGARSLHRVSGSMWLTGAYFLNLEAAKRLAKSRYPIWTVGDHWEAIAKDAKVDLWCIGPTCARETGGPSSIAAKSIQRRIRPHSPLKTRAKKMLYGAIVRPILTQKISRNTV